jgi:hypothetical protein
MEEINHGRQFYAWHHDGFCQAMATKLDLIHCREVLKEKQIAIRFENGYGVIIQPVSLEEEVFEVLVLKFYGAGTNDYQVAQYAPVPELNRGNFDEIIALCKQVALLPMSNPRRGSSGQVKEQMHNQQLARRCSDFL